MNQHGQTICLNMIVKNEAHVIRRCLDSLKGIIDHWVIVDTGSTDGTQDIIREHLRDIPGEVLERQWVNFAHNRSEALVHARGKADYVLIIDADEILEFEDGFTLPRLEHDAYHFEIISGGFAYFKTQLVSNAIEWCFKNVVHEYIHSDAATTEGTLEGVRTIRYTDGARSRDANTYRRDALMLESALIEEPDNSRYVFYLAQSYRDANEPELAIKNYGRRVEMGGWDEEVWYSLYQIAEIRHAMGMDWNQVLESYMTAFQFKPNRAEPLYRVGVYYQARKEFHLAYLFFSRAIAIPYPVDDRLFVEKTIYDFFLPLEHAVCCYYAGEHEEAIDTNNRLLAASTTPGAMIEQVIANRRYSLDRMYPKLEYPAERTNPIKIIVPFHNAGPHLDSCVESVLLARYENFEVIFIDDASDYDHSPKIPLEDSRVRLVRNVERKGWAASLAEAVERMCDAGDIIVPLDGANWLADADALAAVNGFFNDYDCEAMYGQFRYSCGNLGLTIPLAGEGSLELLRRAHHPLSPVIFRARLFAELRASGRSFDSLADESMTWPAAAVENALNYLLLETAGTATARFNDRVLTVVNLDADSVVATEQHGVEEVAEAEGIAD